GRVTVTENSLDFTTFIIRVPGNALAMRIQIENSPADLDLFLKYGEEIQDYNDVDAKSDTDDYNEKLFITRFSDPPLQAGIYYLDVAYQRSRTPRVDKKSLRSIPFKIALELIEAKAEAALTVNQEFSSMLFPETGMVRTFTADVPFGTRDLRVDLYGSNSDLDLLINHGKPALSMESADYASESLLSKESIIISGSLDNPLKPGTYFITVIDQLTGKRPEKFSLCVSFEKEPPAFLLRLPFTRVPENSRENAFSSVVEVISESQKGSGCLVNPAGYIITSYHVVRGNSGDPDGNLTVALNLSNILPPEELFKARVVEYSQALDLALLKISGGLYGQSVPDDYKFPYLSFGDPERLVIGESIGLIGYPGIGGTGSRSSITYTRGVVSGFEETAIGILIKTDGALHTGSSGGAAVNSFFELMGFPTTIIEQNSGHIGFIHTVKMIPEAWLKYFKQAQMIRYY
ncbi:MAG: trypsin-like peptidase domain-containing protein, partial [Spirochaetota bacterium]